jgi:hypothetical protein
LNISSLSHGELFALFANIMLEMHHRGLTRTANNPIADLGEALFCEAMQWERADKQAKTFDATTREKERVQIKARRITRGSDPTRSGTIRDKDGWDLIALVMFGANFSIKRAVIVPKQIALAHMKWSKRQQASYIALTNSFWASPDLIDVTDRLTLCHAKLFALTVTPPHP